MKMPSLVILVVERGWQKSRDMSLLLIKKGLSVDILIKGFAEKHVIDMITPYPAISIKFLSIFWFKPVLFCQVIIGAVSGKLKAVIVEGKKIKKWIYIISRIMRFGVFLVNDESCNNI